MEDAKPYAFNYTNSVQPFELKVRFREGINQLPKEHEACVQVTPAAWNAPAPPPMKVKLFPDDGNNGPEYLMNVVATQFDSTLSSDRIPGEELFKVWQKTVLKNEHYKKM